MTFPANRFSSPADYHESVATVAGFTL